MKKDRAAAIDIGSNSLLLTIAEPGNTPTRVPLNIIHDEAHVTGLSKGLLKDALILDTAFARSEPVFKSYRQTIHNLKAEKVRVTATEALRRAKNGDEIRKRIEKILEHSVELISGDREAELSFWSVQKELADDSQTKIVFDIGGASTELCLGSSKGIEKRVSLKVGSVVLTEKFGLEKKCDPGAAIAHVKNLICEVDWTTPPPSCIGIGVAGTITTLIAADLKLKTYDRDQVHKRSIPVSRLRSWLQYICERETKDRLVPGLTIERADVISGGFSIALALAEHFGWNEVICMDSGIRFGVLYEIFGI